MSYLALAPLYLMTAWALNPPVEERRDYFTPNLSGVVRALLLLGIVSSLFLWSVSKRGIDQEQRKTNVLFSLSFLFLALGAAAYIASGRLVDISEWMLNFVPRASDWDSRHQLLLGFGIALFISTLLMTIETTIRKRVFAGLIAICVVLNFSIMQGYFFDAQKQNEFVSILSKMNDISEWKSVVIADEAGVYNARDREVRSYEWEQMIVEAGGREDVKVMTTTRPCAIDQNPQSAVFLLMESSQGRFASMLKGGVGLSVQSTLVNICP